MRQFPVLAHCNAPNAVTSLSVVFAVAGVLLAFSALKLAILCGAASIVCDVLDGNLARRSGQTSAFGAQLDSLADALAFGVLPAVLGYTLGLRGFAAILLPWYALGAVWRLARFSETGHTATGGRIYFEGVPTTFTAAAFYVVAALSLWLPGGRMLLALFFLGAPVFMNAAVPFPKHGWHVRMMWLLVPLSIGALWLRLT